jgi:hypothetical protein
MEMETAVLNLSLLNYNIYMEPDIQQSTSTPATPRMIDVMPVHPMDEKKRHIIILGTIFIVLIGAAMAYWFYRKNQTTDFIDLSPAEQLQTLKESSQPVTASESERLKDLEDLSKSSQPVKTSEQERLDQLDSLQ